MSLEAKLQRRVQRYGWDIAASPYEGYWRTQLEPAHNRLLEMTALRPGESVLETACGTGLVTFRITEAVGEKGEVLATDISEGMLEMASPCFPFRCLSHRKQRIEIGGLSLR